MVTLSRPTKDLVKAFGGAATDREAAAEHEATDLAYDSV
jgi:hypothetical protein